MPRYVIAIVKVLGFFYIYFSTTVRNALKCALHFLFCVYKGCPNKCNDLYG